MKFNFDFKFPADPSIKFQLADRLLLLGAAALTLVGACWPAALYTSRLIADAVQHGGGFMYLLEFAIMSVAMLVIAGVGGFCLSNALRGLPTGNRQIHRSSLELAERLAFMDEASKTVELEKLQRADAAEHRVVVSMLQQWRAEAQHQAARASIKGLKMSVPRWHVLAEAQAELIKELRRSSSPVKATATDATWLTLPEQRALLNKLSRLMGTDDFNVILHDALRLLFVAYEPGSRHEGEVAGTCAKAMTCLDVLMVMPEVEKPSTYELRDELAKEAQNQPPTA